MFIYELAVSLVRQRSLNDIVSEKRQKKLSLKVTLTVEFAMSLVGVLTFFLWKIQNFTTMVTKITSVVVGIALTGRKDTIFHTIRHWEQL